MHKKILIAVGITILFLGTCITPIVAIDNVKKSSAPISKGNTLYVGGSGEGNYTTIQDAIDDASDGDTVFVYNGTYYENVWVNKSISLIGEDKDTTIIEDSSVHVDAWDVYIKNFSIKGRGIDLSDSNNCIIQNNYVSNGLIKLVNSNYNLILDNKIQYGAGRIFLSHSDYNNITRNSISFNRHSGIGLSSSCMNSIKNNDINSNLVWGVHLSYISSYNDITDNRIINNSGGIYINSYSSHNMIINNILQDNTDGRLGFGLGFTGGCSYNYIMYNVISNNYMGITFAHSRKNTIIKNTIKNHNITDGIYGPSIGIEIDSFCHYNKFEKNNFIDNIEHISSFKSRGNSFISNYWDDWIGLKYNWTLIQRFPKVIIRYFSYDKIFPIFVFDWHPALKPYDI